MKEKHSPSRQRGLRTTLIFSIITGSLSGCVVLVPFIEPYEEPPPKYSYRPAYAGTAAPKTTGTRRPAKLKRYLSQLEDSRPTARTAAASYLGMMGADAVPAVPQLEQKLNDESKFVRRASAKALGRIGYAAPTTLAALERATKDKDPYVAKTAASALRQLESKKTPTDLSPTGRSPMYSSKSGS